MKRFVTQHPLGFGLIVLAAYMLTNPRSGWSQLLPLQGIYLSLAETLRIPPYLSPNCLLPTHLVTSSLLAAGLVAALRWCETGVLSRVAWGQSYLLGVPIVTALWALLVVPPHVDAAQASFLLIGALLTALCNELLFRGAILGALLPSGKLRACLLATLISLGFYLPLLNNLPTLLRDGSPALIVLLVITLGSGLSSAALRLRLNSIWPLVAVNTLSMVTLLSVGPAQLSWTAALVGVVLPYGLLASYGWYLLRFEEHAAVSRLPVLVEHG